MASTPRIVVLGSANVDLTVVVDRRPEWGETVTGRSFRRTVGGKGVNSAIAAARSGRLGTAPAVAMLAAVGADADGELVTGELDRAGVAVGQVRRVRRPTGVAHITVDAAGRNAITVVAGANEELAGPDALTADDRRVLGGARFVLAQLEIPLAGVLAGFEASRAAGAVTLLTPAPVRPLPDDLLDLVDVLLVNEHEAAQVAGVDESEPLARVGEALLERVPAAVVTRGEQGADWFVRDDARVAGGGQPGRCHVDAFATDVVDTTGAGDCFAGAFAVGLDETGDAEAGLRFAAAAAALSVRAAGAAASMPSRAQIDELLSGGEPPRLV